MWTFGCCSEFFVIKEILMKIFNFTNTIYWNSNICVTFCRNRIKKLNTSKTALKATHSIWNSELYAIPLSKELSSSSCNPKIISQRHRMLTSLLGVLLNFPTFHFCIIIRLNKRNFIYLLSNLSLANENFFIISISLLLYAFSFPF